MKMNTRFSWAGWLTLLSRKKPATKARKRQQDFADYGTAFGLDLSLTSQAQAMTKIDAKAQTSVADLPMPTKAVAPAR